MAVRAGPRHQSEKFQAPQMRWLITGGCGFIGINLINALIREGGHDVRVVDNLEVGTRNALESVAEYSEIEGATIVRAPRGIELVVANILDPATAMSAATGVDAIVHLAANTGVAPSVHDPRKDCEVNVFGTLNYLESARHNNVKRFVFASSGAPVGKVDPPIHEELAARPVSPYGASKLAGEGYCSAYWECFGIETVALRFGNVYGPRSLHKNSVVAKFVKDALLNGQIEVHGDGCQTRDFIFIADLVDAVVKASTSPGIGGELFQIATSQETSISELAKIVCKALAEITGKAIRVDHGRRRLGDVPRNYSDTRKASRLLGWESRFTLTQGLQNTIPYFVSALREGAGSS